MKLLLLVFAMATFSVAVNASYITPGQNVQFLALNGLELDEKSQTVQVDSGFVQIVAKYNATLGKGNNKRVFDSQPVVLEFSNDGFDVLVVAPKAYSYEQAKILYSDNPRWELTSGGKEVEFTQSLLQGNEGLLPFASIPSLLSSYNNQRGIDFEQGVLSEERGLSVAKSGEIEKRANTNTSELEVNDEQGFRSQNLNQLKAWYLKSSDEERKAFRRWIIDHD